jgi:hypothetical protein
MVSADTLIFAMELVLKAITQDLRGAIVECGVWRGGTSMAMMLVQRRYLGRVVKPVYMLDSFEGLPPTTEKDGQFAESFVRGEWGAEFKNCVVDISDVSQWLADAGLVEGDFFLVKGWFDKTVPALAEKLQDSNISVLRVDGDWYNSTKICLDHLVPCVTTNGFVIVDDYVAFDGCARAVHDFLSESRRPCRLRSPRVGDGILFRNALPGPP